MKVVFIGASTFGLRCLEAISSLKDVEIVGVITNEQQFKISYAPEGVSNVLYANFKDYAEKIGLPVYLMQSKMNEPDLLSQIDQWQPDLFVVVGWYHIVPTSLLKRVPAVGLHASLLPDYSGGAPLVWAMINGEKKTGITLFEFSDGVDNGPIIGQAATEIDKDDTIATLYGRIEELGIKLLFENLPLIANGTATYTIQDERFRRLVPQRSPKDGRIDWSQSADKIYDFIRAQTHPYPGAFTTYEGKNLSIWSSSIVDGERVIDKIHGSYYLSDGGLLVVCGKQSLLRIGNVSFDDDEQSAEKWYLNMPVQCEGVFV